jgi:hypothetical protein
LFTPTFFKQIEAVSAALSALQNVSTVDQAKAVKMQ